MVYITDAKFDGNKIVTCDLNGIPVILKEKLDYSSKSTWVTIGARMGGASMICGAFFPGVGHAAGLVVGYASALWNEADETGYYDRNTGRLIHKGILTKDSI